MEIKINPEYEAILPKLQANEYASLKQSVETDGLHYPIIVNEQGTILDGHHRFRICRELGVEPRYEIKRFPNTLLEKKFVIVSNLQRRQLNDFQRAELALPLEQIEAELARQRQGTRTDLDRTSGSFEPEVGRARDIVAKTAGLSSTTYQRAKKILSEGSEKLKDSVRSGATSIAFAYKKLLRDVECETPPSLPEGEFDVIYADPPWDYDLQLRGSPDMHYPVMSQEEICALKVPAAKNAMLFLWATNPKLKEALQVMESWGFSYRTNMVWVKDKFGTGYYVRGQHELLLIGKKGDFPVPSEADRPSSVVESPRMEHSRKPNVFYTIIEKLYPNHKYLELFARKPVERENWIFWGAENTSKT